MATIAARFEASNEKLRETFGAWITYNSVNYRAKIKAIPKRDAEDLAAGLGINAANADLRYIDFTPSDFKTGLPQENDIVSWDEGYGMRPYIIAKAVAPMIDTTTTKLKIMVYRQGAKDAATTETAGEPTPGVRKDYSLPKNPMAP